jgi:hypothetical protein
MQPAIAAQEARRKARIEKEKKLKFAGFDPHACAFPPKLVHSLKI